MAEINTIWIILLYCSPSSSLTIFFDTLDIFVSDHCIIDIVLGDFSIDILNNTNINLQNVFPNYTLLVNQATRISGSFFDHVYVKNEMLQKFLVDKTKIVLIFLIMM